MANQAFRIRPLPTIFSVGRGRCVVVAADGCEDCVSAFSEYVKNGRHDDDRIIVVLIQLPESWLNSMYGQALHQAHSERMRQEEVNRGRLAERVAELINMTPPGASPRVLNISTPGTGTAVIDSLTAPVVLQRLKWDNDAKADLAKFVDVAIRNQVRFEAVLLKANNPNEAVVKYCENVAADLLVLGKHTNRILNWVKDIGMIPYCQEHAPCTVHLLGESRGEDREGEEGGMRRGALEPEAREDLYAVLGDAEGGSSGQK